MRLYLRGTTYHYDAFVNGKRVRGTTGTSDETEALKIAEKEIQLVMERMDVGMTVKSMLHLYNDPKTNPRRIASKITGESYGEDYANEMARQSKDIEKILADKQPKILAKKVAELTSLDINLVRKAIYDVHGARRKAQYEFRSFKAFISQLHDDGVIDNNVGAGMKDIHYSATPRRAVRPEILSLIVDAKDKFQDVEDWAYAVFAMSTGMRKSEILAIKKEHLFGNTLRVEEAIKTNDGKIGKPKGNFIRVIPLSKLALYALSFTKPDRSGRYFPHERRWTTTWTWHFRKAMCEAYPQHSEEWNRITSHIFRHSLNTNLLVTGLAESLVSEYMSWEHQHLSDIQENYTHFIAKDMQCVADRIDEIYGFAASVASKEKGQEENHNLKAYLE